VSVPAGKIIYVNLKINLEVLNHGILDKHKDIEIEKKYIF